MQLFGPRSQKTHTYTKWSVEQWQEDTTTHHTNTQDRLTVSAGEWESAVSPRKTQDSSSNLWWAAIWVYEWQGTEPQLVLFFFLSQQLQQNSIHAQKVSMLSSAELRRGMLKAQETPLDRFIQIRKSMFLLSFHCFLSRLWKRQPFSTFLWSSEFYRGLERLHCDPSWPKIWENTAWRTESGCL